jgi:hypothetical protein
MIQYGNARNHPQYGFCCTDAETGRFILDEHDQPIPADPRTGAPKSELPPICPECKRPLPAVRKP